MRILQPSCLVPLTLQPTVSEPAREYQLRSGFQPQTLPYSEKVSKKTQCYQTYFFPSSLKGFLVTVFKNQEKSFSCPLHLGSFCEHTEIQRKQRLCVDKTNSSNIIENNIIENHEMFYSPTEKKILRWQISQIRKESGFSEHI